MQCSGSCCVITFNRQGHPLFHYQGTALCSVIDCFHAGLVSGNNVLSVICPASTRAFAAANIPQVGLETSMRMGTSQTSSRVPLPLETNGYCSPH